MIKSRDDYKFYLEADWLSQGAPKPTSLVQKMRFSLDSEIYNFKRLLRKTEYYSNCSKNVLGRNYAEYLRYRLYKSGLKLGFTIGANSFGPGLSITHIGTITVNRDSKIGANCLINPGVLIGTKAGYLHKAPTIGNNVFIGPGAKIIGDITIADGIAIGANSVVNRSFLEPNITIAGVPAKKVSNKGSRGLLNNGTDLALKKQNELRQKKGNSLNLFPLKNSSII